MLRKILLITVGCIIVIFGILFFYRTLSHSVVENTPKVESPSFGGVSLKLEYATTTAARERGLGGRVNIAQDYGMLFVFPHDDYYGFWMKDMVSSIDMFWLDSQGQVVFVERNVAPSSYPHVFYPSRRARYVLETASGFAVRHDVQLGTPLVLKNFPTVTQ